MKKIIILATALLAYSIISAQTFQSSDCEKGCKDPLNTREPMYIPADDASSSGGYSVDPNEIIGPMGYDSVRWVSVNDVLNYTILFENDPEFATAHAQIVDIRFNFPDKRLMKDFGLNTFGFANMAFEIADHPNIYQTRIDLKDSMQIYVDLISGLDMKKQQGFWHFSTLDPISGYAPWQVDRGMLPVNDSTHVGEGFVTFSIKPNEDMQTGDTISLAANIVFDQNDTIPTNRWCNKVDAGMPTSKVIATQDTINELLYHLSFEAADDKNGSGLNKVYLYLANNMGVYEEYAMCKQDSIIDFLIEKGRQYKLYALAEDNVGNKEPLKENPDVVLNFNAAPTDIALSDSIFQDDLEIGGFIGELSSVDTEYDVNFTYALAEGDGAIHNDLFQIVGTQLQTKSIFKCAEDSVYNVRLATTDEGGLTFSKAFTLHLAKVLEKPQPDTLTVDICEGDSYNFHGTELDESGTYYFSKSNDYMCDSVFVLHLHKKPIPQIPMVTVENGRTLVSSIAQGNQWYKDGERIEGATANAYTPTETGIYHVLQTNGTCESQPSDKFYANLDNNVSFTLPLSQGWTWISSNLFAPEKRDPQQWLAPIIRDVERFVGTDSELVADQANGLIGTLKEIEPTEAYKIQVKQDTQLDMSGLVYLPDDVTKTLHEGWNWLGYIPTVNMAIADALAHLTPQENDIIKGLSDFAVYTNGKWIGTLTTLKQGEGYMYHSTSNTSFQYPYSRITKVVDESSVQIALSPAVAPTWEANVHKYPSNMTLIGEAIANDVIAPAGAYTIAAFCGEECRGVGEYVNDRLFLTIHGQPDDANITFKAIENATGQECSVAEFLTFGEDGVGTYAAPFKLHIGTSTTNISAAGQYNIYPNPVRNVLYINGSIDNIQSVKVIAVSGAVMNVKEQYDTKGLDVSHLSDGNYILSIVTDTGIVYKHFVKAK